jgi:Flp pilus assembly protein TadG
MIRSITYPRSSRRRPAGSTMIEAVFVLMLVLGFSSLIIDTAWGIFAKVTLQHAVRAAVRYGVTSQTSTSGGQPLGQVASIKQVVQQQAMGFLSASDTATYVTVTFYSVSTNPPQAVAGVGSNTAGNLVIVSVNNWPLNPIAPLLHGSTPTLLSVSSADLIESTGSGGAPPPL